MTVNEDLRDLAIRHAVLVARMARTEAGKLAQTLRNDVLVLLEARLLGRIARIKSRGGVDTGPWTTAQYAEAVRVIREISASATTTYRGGLERFLVEFGVSEIAWQKATIERLVPFDLQLGSPSTSLVRELVRGEPFSGQFLRDHVRQLDTGTRARLVGALNDGMIRGDGAKQIAGSIRSVLDTTARNAETLTRTAITHVGSGVRRQMAAENSDIYRGEVWVSTLDLRTSAPCWGLDGTEFPVGVGPRPPIHYNCRSTMSPVLKSIDEILGTKGAGDFSRADRASMDGQVPASTTFEDFLRRQSRADQDLVMGRSRAALWRSGRVPIKSFVDRNYRQLSLAELVARESR